MIINILPKCVDALLWKILIENSNAITDFRFERSEDVA